MCKCKAKVVFGDDQGDNETTFHCQLEENHVGKHEEAGDLCGQKYKLWWDGTGEG